MTAHVSRYGNVLAAYTKHPGEHTTVSKLTGVKWDTCKKLWAEGDKANELPPISSVIEVTNSPVPNAAMAFSQEIISSALVATGLHETATATREAKDMVANAVECALEQIRLNRTKALVDEQKLISASRNTLTGVLAISSRLVHALHEQVEEQIAALKKLEGPEFFSHVERVTEIIHKIGIASKNISEMERNLQVSAGGSTGATLAPSADKPRPSASNAAESIETIIKAGKLFEDLKRQASGEVQDVPYQEESS